MESGAEDTGKRAKILLYSNEYGRLAQETEFIRFPKSKDSTPSSLANRFENRFFENTFSGVGS